MNVLVLALASRRNGRGKALLSCCDELATVADVTLVVGDETPPESALESYHGFLPAVEWRRIEWDGDVSQLVDEQIGRVDPDVVIAWDDPLHAHLSEVDRATIAWVEASYTTAPDECWSPSQCAARRCRDALRDLDVDARVLTMYPHWYIEPQLETPSIDERPIDVLVHGRKNRNAADLLEGYTVVTTGDFSAAELNVVYRQSKLFLFPRPWRAEPLGLMPIEAAARGCRVAVPTNSGVAELFPSHAYEQPVKEVDRLLSARDDTDAPDIPSPSANPATRIEALS